MGIKTITVTTGIEDTTLKPGADADKNYGGWSLCMGFPTYVVLVRLAANQIPFAQIAKARFVVSSVTYNGAQNIYRLKDAAAWVVGTENANPQEGSCCYNGIAYSAGGTTPWTGGAAFSSSDYVADTNPPQLNPALLNNFAKVELPVVWFTNWRDGITVANGFALLAPTAQANFNSMNSGTASLRPYFEFDIYDGAQNEPVPSQSQRSHPVDDDDNSEFEYDVDQVDFE